MATILYVEDDEFYRQQFTEALTNAGFTVLSAEDGHEAWEIFLTKETDIQLVITDHDMPRMNGEQLIHNIREKNKFTPIFWVTDDYNLFIKRSEYEKKYTLKFFDKSRLKFDWFIPMVTKAVKARRIK